MASNDDSLPHHEVRGEGRTTVFLLHGAYGGGRYFAYTRDLLVADGYRVVVWDAPGYGGTPVPDDNSIENHSIALVNLVRAVGKGSNVLLGHSMGALIAPRATVAEPTVNGLVLSSASAGFASRSAEDQARYLAERLAPIESGLTVAEYVRPLLSTMMGPGASGPLVDRVVETICAMPTETLAASIRAITRFDSRPSLGAVTVPTLLLAGSKDSACPPEGMRKIHKMIEGSELYELDGVGHYGFAERPEEWHGHLLTFLHHHFPA